MTTALIKGDEFITIEDLDLVNGIFPAVIVRIPMLRAIFFGASMTN